MMLHMLRTLLKSICVDLKQRWVLSDREAVQRITFAFECEIFSQMSTFMVPSKENNFFRVP
jgi:hypothetical protein